MKKRTGLGIAGGILEIIAGVEWLGYILLYFLTMSALNIKINFETLDYVMFIPILFIFYGVIACCGTKQRNQLYTYGIINILFIAYLIYKAVATQMNASLFLYMTIGEIVLLLIASILFFVSPKSDWQVIYENEKNKYINAEPTEIKIARKKINTLMTIPIVVSALLSIIIVLLKLAGTAITVVSSVCLVAWLAGVAVILNYTSKESKKEQGHLLKANIGDSIVGNAIGFIWYFLFMFMVGPTINTIGILVAIFFCNLLIPLLIIWGATSIARNKALKRIMQQKQTSAVMAKYQTIINPNTPPPQQTYFQPIQQETIVQPSTEQQPLQQQSTLQLPSYMPPRPPIPPKPPSRN